MGGRTDPDHDRGDLDIMTITERGTAATGDGAGQAPAISATERVGGVWSGRLSVTKIWAKGMNNPLVARGFWRLAYGCDATAFYRDWERLADEAPGTRVLDVPSGAGVFLLGLAPGSGIEYTAVDISADMVARVNARIAEKGLTGATARQADATRLPFEDGSMDLVLTYNGLHCFNEPWTALAEFRRVLADGGRIRGTILLRRPGLTPNKVQDYFQWRGLLGTIGTWAEVQGWFAQAGLTVTRTEQNGALAFFEGGPA